MRSSARPSAAAIALFLAAVATLPGIPRAAMAQTAASDAATDGADFRVDALLATPDQLTPVPQDNLIATAPGLEQQTPLVRITGNVLAPIYYNSNAESASSGGTQTVEGSPFVGLSIAGQLGELPVRLSSGVNAEWDRYGNAPSAEFDKLRTYIRLQYVDAANDQAFSPFVSFVPRQDFTPTFAVNFATRYDLNLGFNKVFAFDGNFDRVPFSSSSAAASVWRFGLTVLVQRRFRSAPPESYALFAVPSVSYVISPQWNASLAIDLTRRWFDAFAGTSQRNFTLEPVAVLEYVVPATWLGGERTARLFGRPAIDGLVGVERNWSNVSTASFTQFVAGLVFKFGWRF